MLKWTPKARQVNFTIWNQIEKFNLEILSALSHLQFQMKLWTLVIHKNLMIPMTLMIHR